MASKEKDGSVEEKNPAGNEAAKPDNAPKPPDEEAEPVITKHKIQVDGKTLRYTVTTGRLPIRSDAGETEGHIFFMAYTRENADRSATGEQRPLMFSFNGGPGSSSVWLHLGALGPRRVRMLEDGSRRRRRTAWWTTPSGSTRPTWYLSTRSGPGTAAPQAQNWARNSGVEGDIASVGEFIRLYLTRYERWASPLFLVGKAMEPHAPPELAEHLINRVSPSTASFLYPRFSTSDRRLRQGQRPSAHPVPADVHGHRLLSPPSVRRPAGKSAGRAGRGRADGRCRSTPSRWRKGTH